MPITKQKVMRRPRQKLPATAPPIGSVWVHKEHEGCAHRPATIVKYGRPRGEFTYVYYRHEGSLAKTNNCASLSWFLEHYREGEGDRA
jgi:hypothetical protein